MNPLTMMGTDSDKQDIPHPASRELFDVFDSRDDLQQMRKSLKKRLKDFKILNRL